LVLLTQFKISLTLMHTTSTYSSVAERASHITSHHITCFKTC
jgi:hypothetical protein